MNGSSASFRQLGVTAVMLPELDFAAQIALCVKLGIHYYQLRPRSIPDAERSKPPSPWGNHRFDCTPERLVTEGPAMAAALAAAGMEAWGTLPSACIDDSDDVLLLHTEGAVASAAGRVRINPSPYPARPFDYRELLARTTDRYAAIIDRITGPAGIKVLLETHSGGIASSPGLARILCAGFAPRDVGVILDLGNLVQEGEISPVLAIAALREWIDCVHIGGARRLEAGTDEAGCRRIGFRSCALAESDLSATAWLAAIAAAGLHPPIIIEDFGDYADGPGRLQRSAATLRRVMGIMHGT